MEDEKYMQMALEEGEKGRGLTDPNPVVGAVIVKDGKVISKSYHKKYGEFHAERNALLQCREDPAGATMYVTLEPCCHQGKTPPCTDIIIEKKIGKVVIGTLDPNKRVAGKGARILEAAGIEVVTGVLEKDCIQTNQIFFHYITQNRPFVIMKYAMTSDGKIATVTGESQWITGKSARGYVHRFRHFCMGIMVGIGTVLADDPTLTCRLPGKRDPIRIICDTHLRIPDDCNIVKTAGEVPTYVVTCSEDEAAIKTLEEKGIKILKANEKDGHVDLVDAMRLLGEEGINSILLEGGGELNFSAIESGIVNKVQVYIAPKLIGGRDAKGPVGGRGIEKLSEAVELCDRTVIDFGDDLLLEYDVKGEK